MPYTSSCFSNLPPPETRYTHRRKNRKKTEQVSVLFYIVSSKTDENFSPLLRRESRYTLGNVVKKHKNNKYNIIIVLYFHPESCAHKELLYQLNVALKSCRSSLVFLVPLLVFNNVVIKMIEVQPGVNFVVSLINVRLSCDLQKYFLQCCCVRKF